MILCSVIVIVISKRIKIISISKMGAAVKRHQQITGQGKVSEIMIKAAYQLIKFKHTNLDAETNNCSSNAKYRYPI